MALIEVSHLQKSYGAIRAVKDVSFSVDRGEVVGFLGPNGAGKTTTMKILTGYLAPSAGTARIAGFDMSTDRLRGAAKLGYLPENGPLYPDMTPRTLLEFFADAHEIPSLDVVDAVLELTDIRHLEGQLVATLSKGQKQRLQLARILL